MHNRDVLTRSGLGISPTTESLSEVIGDSVSVISLHENGVGDFIDRMVPVAVLTYPFSQQKHSPSRGKLLREKVKFRLRGLYALTPYFIRHQCGHETFFGGIKTNFSVVANAIFRHNASMSRQALKRL